jgi:hypothetical protein
VFDDVVFPPDNVFGLPADTLTGDPIVSDGFWVMLPPLSPGDHNGSAPGDYTLHFRAGLGENSGQAKKTSDKMSHFI